MSSATAREGWLNRSPWFKDYVRRGERAKEKLGRPPTTITFTCASCGRRDAWRFEGEDIQQCRGCLEARIPLPRKPALVVICDWCGEQVQRKRLRKPAYCSKKCREAARWKRRRQEQSREVVKPGVVWFKACRGCGKSFETKHNKARWCSDACRMRHARRKRYSADETVRIQASLTPVRHEVSPPL
jgi:hypothetical protein